MARVNHPVRRQSVWGWLLAGVVLLGATPAATAAERLLIESAGPRSAQPPITIQTAPANPTAQESASGEVDPSRAAPSSWRQTARHNAWVVFCNDAAKSCRMIYAAETARQAAAKASPFALSIEMARQGAKARPIPVLVIRTPINLVLPQGLSVRADKRAPFRLAIRNCEVEHAQGRLLGAGCIAPAPLKGPLLRAFKAGNMARITARAITGETLAQTFDLKGFTKTYKAFQASLKAL